MVAKMLIACGLMTGLCAFSSLPVAMAEDKLAAEVARRIATGFTKCGEDYYSQVSVPGMRQAYAIEQYKDLDIKDEQEDISRAEYLNGIKAKRVVVITASARRKYGKTGYPPKSSWSPWVDEREGQTVEAFMLQDIDGHITTDPLAGGWGSYGKPMQRKGIECTKIPH